MPKGTPALEKKPAGRPAAKQPEPFLIVAIGASSGGLEAITELLQHLPADTGMAFIFIQHLSPDYKSILTSLLAKSTKMAVREIDDMERMNPDNIYVIPNDKDIEVTDDHIKLVPRRRNGPAMSIDVLFTSLAETHHEHAIGVILSGNASDGTLGLKAIKAAGGVTFAQDNSARYHSMPDSAIKEGVADFILSPKEIAFQLAAISRHDSKRRKDIAAGNEITIDDNDPDLSKVLEYLHEGVGVDFGHYKMSTVKRRILRRMFFHKVSTIKQYAKLLKTNSEEVSMLFDDLLINVTDFFRDADAFQYFKTTLFPKLIKSKNPGETLRIWVVACATGQEAFSIAMLLIELMGDNITEKQVQIFATDLSEHAIKKARAGIYSAEELKLVSSKRLERFFTRVDGNYRIAKSVRDLCAFAPHNILSNPPFSRIDFISCCNLLIYLDTVLQKKMLTTFHYALNDGGCLMLGKSETIGSSPLFTSVDRKFKIYTRKDGARSLPDLLYRAPRKAVNNTRTELFKDTAEQHYLPAVATIDSILFTRYIPAYVVINYAMAIVQFKGDTARYLEHGTGKATLDIMNMARPEIAFDLLGAIHKAIETQQDVRKEDIEIRNNAAVYHVSLDVIPINTEGEEPQLLVVFKEQAQVILHENSTGDGKGTSSVKNISIKKLKESLAVARAELLSVSEEKEKAYRIMQAAKDEILSRNEEFQCLNEELETSKEEIESANEELITTNQELQTRNEQLGEAYEFSEAIVTTLHEPMLILDNNLRIKSANKAFYKKFLVSQKDTEGKVLYDIGEGEWDTADLRDLLESIIQKETHFYDYEISRIFPHIGKRTILLNARRIVQKVNKEQLILLAFTDTTEKMQKRNAETKELEDIISERTKELKASYIDLKDKNVSLEKMNKELEMFTFLSSHDLQEPLRKIRNFASCLLDEEQPQLSDTGKDYLQRMQETVRRMQQLIEDLLSYSRVKSKVRSIDKTDLNVVVEDVLTDFEVLIKEKNAIINVGKLCELSIIRFQFRQLLYNLISNSLKFCIDGRQPVIGIKCTVVSSDKLKLASLVPGIDYCHIVFTDNGIGFDPQYKDRIFEVFQRLHEYDEYKGTGIGLAICKRIVENHNGIITATGKPGKGVKFDIYIPATG